MSDRAMEYVLSLGRDQVTRSQKAVLLVIARHHSERYGAADVDLETLSEEILLGRRRLRQIFAQLGEIIDYRPGLGSGNYGQFGFRELSRLPEIVTGKEEKGKQRGSKGELSDTAIRKYLNLDQKNKPP
jgi:hypothetical protein